MRIESLLALLTLAVAGFACGAAQAADKRPATLANQQGTALSEKGADTCLGCHDEESSDEKYQVKPIFQSKHGQRGHARSPFAKGALQCEACHGPGGRHSVKDSNKLTTINSFKADSYLSVGERNQACLSCHQDQTRNAWHGHHSYEGPRHVLQLNWMVDVATKEREEGRHKLSAFLKKLNPFG